MGLLSVQQAPQERASAADHLELGGHIGHSCVVEVATCRACGQSPNQLLGWQGGQGSARQHSQPISWRQLIAASQSIRTEMRPMGEINQASRRVSDSVISSSVVFLLPRQPTSQADMVQVVSMGCNGVEQACTVV